jgi:hypothetical protein
LIPDSRLASRTSLNRFYKVNLLAIFFTPSLILNIPIMNLVASLKTLSS